MTDQSFTARSVAKPGTVLKALRRQTRLDARGGESVRLKVGDSIYFDSGMGHAYVAAGESACRALSFVHGARVAVGRPDRSGSRS